MTRINDIMVVYRSFTSPRCHGRLHIRRINDIINFFCVCKFKNLTADGIKDLLYSWRLKAGVLYLLPEGIIS